jgi:hypothetical protein
MRDACELNALFGERVMDALQAQSEHSSLRPHPSHAVERVPKAALADAEDVTEVRDREGRGQACLHVGLGPGNDRLSRR